MSNKKDRCFNYKEKGYIIYNYPNKKKIIIILESLSEDSNSQGKKQLFPNLKKIAYLFFYHSFSEDLFCDNFFIIEYILDNKIKLTSLVNIYTI